jgi:mannonate dehydratase
VIPVAETNGVKMAVNPDDPPVPSLHGISRILTSADAIRKAFLFSDSPLHGLTFCQRTYTSMQEDLPGLSHGFGGKKKNIFCHIRDVVCTQDKFRETFHDNSRTDSLQ